MLNLAKQSDAIGSPLSQPDRRVHKKVHLNTTTRARAISRSRAGALRADVGVARKCPIWLQQPFDAPSPARYRTLCGPLLRNIAGQLG